ncbi:hypothetical protein L1887_39270 [Cichorium endivia]|nr:hypothetical protein L1887_39270 [Cichorium endivia]
MPANTFQMLCNISLGTGILSCFYPAHLKEIILFHSRWLTAISYNFGKGGKERFLASSTSLTSIIQS